jgi:hypothetical protein
METMAELCEGDKFPTLKTIIEMQRAKAMRKAHSAAPMQELTEAERKRADHAAILSMLWLHYEMGWKLEDFAGSTMGRLFGGDPRNLIEKAKRHYDRETVKCWMDARP